MEVTWTNLAVETLNDILDYVEENFNQAVAERVGDSIVFYVDSLAQNPHLGHAVSDWQRFGDIRRLTYKKNVIYYLVHDSVIEVVLVWDGRRSPWDMEELLLEFFLKFNRTKQ